jgi:mRNA interferase MazF
MVEAIPDAGDLVWLTFDPQAGREQAGRRPAVVLTAHDYNRKTSLAVCCPITSRDKGYAFAVALSPAAPIHGFVLVDHVKSVDWRARRAEIAGRIDSASLETVRDLLAVLLHM